MLWNPICTCFLVLINASSRGKQQTGTLFRKTAITHSNRESNEPIADRSEEQLNISFLCQKEDFWHQNELPISRQRGSQFYSDLKGLECLENQCLDSQKQSGDWLRGEMLQMHATVIPFNLPLQPFKTHRFIDWHTYPFSTGLSCWACLLSTAMSFEQWNTYEFWKATWQDWKSNTARQERRNSKISHWQTFSLM